MFGTYHNTYHNLLGGAAAIALLGTANPGYAQTAAGTRAAAGVRAGANANATRRTNAGTIVKPIQPADVNAARRAQARARVNVGATAVGTATRGYDEYWDSYWGWYGNNFRPYWNRRYSIGVNDRGLMRNNLGAGVRGMRANRPGFETRIGVDSRARLGGGFESRYFDRSGTGLFNNSGTGLFNNSGTGLFNNSAGVGVGARRVGNTAGVGGFGGANRWY